MSRRTLLGSVRRAGVGVHSGCPSEVILRPAASSAGVRFLTADGIVPLSWRTAAAGAGCSVVRSGAAAVATPEHLLAALFALEVLDVDVEVRSSSAGLTEVPILGGAASDWVAAIDEAGRTEPQPGPPPLSLPEVEVHTAGGSAHAGPGSDTLAVDVDFGAGGPTGSLTVERTEAAFREHVMWARTFVREEDVAALVAAGRGRGATPENTVVWPTSALHAPESRATPSRYNSPGSLPSAAGLSDEPVRHKLLDLWGDLAVLGPFCGWVRVRRPSHALNHALVAAIASAVGGDQP
ncbi:MAG: UDP-3-O-acyl-N-acetylglucosamine deacetylase [Myxococcales bacterium]|nr:UDP-3-O-acyl-N-acetylglucosamine deacetylase [Myxococcales bacterium]